MSNKLLRMLRRNKRGAASLNVSAEGVGYGLAAAGGIVAVATLFALIWVPAATFTTLDGEYGAVIGVALLVLGLIIHAMGTD